MRGSYLTHLTKNKIGVTSLTQNFGFFFEGKFFSTTIITVHMYDNFQISSVCPIKSMNQNNRTYSEDLADLVEIDSKLKFTSK